jgi:hypothetical protein
VPQLNVFLILHIFNMWQTSTQTKQADVRHALLDEARDEWWKLEVGALRSDLQDIVVEVKTQGQDVQEILKLVCGVQESLNKGVERYSKSPDRVQHSVDSMKTHILSPDTGTTTVSKPGREVNETGTHLQLAPLSFEMQQP